MPDDIEMTTFKDTSIDKKPNGSFSGKITLQAGSYIEVLFDSATRLFDVKTITSEARGDGTILMREADVLADEAHAIMMQTATSRPGFFLNFGFDYSDRQKATNALKYTAQELLAQEANREDVGGGFEMIKMPPFV